MPEKLNFLPIVDNAALEKLTGYKSGSQSLIAALSGAFKESASQSLREMKAAIDEKDWKKIAFAAHRLKSTSSTLGLARVTQICRELEANVDCPTDMSFRFERLEKEIEDASQELFKTGVAS